MKKMKRWNLLMLLVFSVCLLVGCGTKPEAGSSEDSSIQTPTKEPEPQPLFGEFSTTDIEENEVTNDIFTEYELTMVNVWGTFCPPCIDEMPDLGKIHEAYKEKGFQVVGIVSDVLNDTLQPDEQALQTAKEIVSLTNASYVHIVPSIDMVYNTLQYVQSVPTTFFVDKEGKQVGKAYVGARSEEKWIEIIEELLEENSNYSTGG